MSSCGRGPQPSASASSSLTARPEEAASEHRCSNLPTDGQRMPRRGNELVVISWRDIPAQVNARSGAAKHQVVLARRFQRAIDDAAMVAGKKTANEYVGEWRRAALPLPEAAAEIAAAAEEEARRLEDAFPKERLQRFVANGGWDPES